MEAVQLDELGPQHSLAFALVLDRLGPPVSLDQKLEAAPHAVSLDDPDDGTDRVEDVGTDLVHVLPLRDGEQLTVPVERGLNRLHGSGATCGHRDRNAGVYDHVPQRQYRKREPLAHDSSSLS
jgi:hypothetical protein